MAAIEQIDNRDCDGLPKFLEPLYAGAVAGGLGEGKIRDRYRSQGISASKADVKGNAKMRPGDREPHRRAGARSVCPPRGRISGRSHAGDGLRQRRAERRQSLRRGIRPLVGAAQSTASSFRWSTFAEPRSATLRDRVHRVSGEVAEGWKARRGDRRRWPRPIPPAPALERGVRQTLWRISWAGRCCPGRELLRRCGASPPQPAEAGADGRICRAHARRCWPEHAGFSGRN